MPRLRNATGCLRAAEQAFSWLKTRLEKEEQWAVTSLPLSVYYKVPYLFLITGHPEPCRLGLNWIRNNLLTDDGSLLCVPATEGAQTEPAAVRETAWVARTAHFSGRFDISYPVIDFLVSCQGRNTGGVYETTRGVHAADADARSTACAGLAYLASGRIEAARRAGDFLAQTVMKQLDSTRFHVRVDAMGQPVTKFPKENAGHYVLSKARGKTDLSYLGLPMVFLSRLYLATGEQEWLDAGADYFAVGERYAKDGWSGPGAGTVGWGAATLYDLTRRRFYYDAAEAVSQTIIKRMGPDGAYAARGKLDEAEQIRLTAEIAVCLTETVREAQ